MEHFPKITVLLFFFLCLSIFFNIPIFRQVIGFLWLTLIPGYAFLRILRLNKWDSLDMLVFSAGAGLAIVTLLGFILNNVSLALNFPNLLSTIPFIAALGIFTLILLLIGWSQEINATERQPLNLNVKLTDTPQIFVLAAVLFLSITGALYQNISLLLFMIIGVSFLILISILSEKCMPSKLFSLTIAVCSLALLFHTALISKHLMGVDIFMEFYVFTQTKAKGVWIAPGNIMHYSLIDDLNSILSVTVFPAIGTSVLGIEGEIFFKIFYPLIFSIVPLALYKMYQQQVEAKSAFLSTALYISLPIAFYGIEPLALCRQIIGQLFLVLSIALMLDKKIVSSRKNILLALLTTALITAHYALAYIFLFYAAVFYFAPKALYFLKEESYRKILGLSTVVLITVITFAWYTYVSSSPLNHMLSSFSRIASMFSRDFGSLEARGFVGAVSSLSPFVTTSIVGLTHKVLVYTQFLFIGIGILSLAIKPKAFDISFEYRLLSLASAAVLLLCLVVPNLAFTLNPTRFYAIAIMFLSPLFVLGGKFLTSLFVRFALNISRSLKKINVDTLGMYIVTFVLIATFLFQVGFVNHITHDYPYSYSLDLDRKETSNRLDIKVTMHSLYFLDQEVLSAEWLAEKATTDLKVYADWNSQCSVLKSYAKLPDYRMAQIINSSEPESQTYIYLKYITTQLGLISLANGALLNSSDALPAIANYNVIYSNGISDIYFTH